jgi:chromosomal replication initiator protein
MEPLKLNGVATIPLRGQTLHDTGGSNDLPNGRTASDQFVIGPENRLAGVAVQSILAGPPNGYNPVVFYGRSGVGKTHLAYGLASAWRAAHRRRRVVYATAVDFARELADAIETQAVDEFRSKYRKAALLALEDLNGLTKGKSGKLSAQDELVHTLDALIDGGGWVVVTAMVAPGALSGIAPTLQSRLLGGLTVPLWPPGPEARLLVLQNLAAGQQVHLPRSVAQLLADGLSLTVPELRGALLQLDMQARAQGHAIDLETAHRFLAGRAARRLPPLKDIAAATARYFSLKLSDLRGPSRRRALVTARGAAMYLARSLTQHSLNQIGEYFGGRDHTTVMHGCHKTASLVKIDPAIRRAIEELQQQWQTT